MNWQQMVEEAAGSDKDFAGRFIRSLDERNEKLAKLIQQHGVDWNGFKEYYKNSFDSLFNKFNKLVYSYAPEIPQEGIQMPRDDMWVFASGQGCPASLVPYIKDFVPNFGVTRINFSQNGKFDSEQRKRLVHFFSVPENRKNLLTNLNQVQEDYTIPAAELMPDMSREDAEYLEKELPSNTFNTIAEHADLSPEFYKTYLRKLASTNSDPLKDAHTPSLLKALEQVMDSSGESPETRDFANRSAINLVAWTDPFEDFKMKDVLDLVSKMPASELKRHLETMQFRLPDGLVKKLNAGQFSPEQNVALDEWARKDSEHTAAARFIGGDRASELMPSELESIMKNYMAQIDVSGNTSTFGQTTDSHKMNAAIGLLPKETIDRMIDERFQKGLVARSDSVLGLWKYLNPRGESPSNEAFQSDTELNPRFIEDKFDLDHKMRLDGAKKSIVTSDDLMKLVPKTKDASGFTMKMLTHPNLTNQVLSEIKYLNLGDSEDLDYPLDGMGIFNNLTSTSKSPSILDGTHGRKTDTRIGSTALRQLRDHLDQKAAEGVASLRPEELPKGRTFNTLTRAVTDKKGNVQHVLDWNPLRDSRSGGNLTSEKVREAIDAMPVRSIVVRNTKPWTGLQNHTKDGTSVMQFMPSAEAMQKIRDAGLWTAFGEMSRHHMEEGTYHPTAPFHLGWIRFSTHPDNEEVFIDEIQSDLHTSFRQLMKEPDNKLKDQMQSVMDILFGKHHPSEVMHEAFHQNLRDSGMVGHKVHIHGVKSKAHMSLQDPDKPVPAHFKEGYDAIPKKMSYTPAKYGDLSVETGDGDPKARKLKGMDTHGTKVVKFEEMLFELSKGEW